MSGTQCFPVHTVLETFYMAYYKYFMNISLQA